MRDHSAKFIWDGIEEGIELQVVVNQPVQECFYPDVSRGDGIELFFDTRDVKTSGYNTRFCHHFFFLPEAVDGHQAGELTRFRTEDVHDLCDPNELKIKSREAIAKLPAAQNRPFDASCRGGGSSTPPSMSEPPPHEPAKPVLARGVKIIDFSLAASFATTSQTSSRGYSLQIFIPSQCLYGYDPDQFDRMGFSYRLNRYRGDPQHFSAVTDEYQIEQQPSLWSSVQLVRE